MSRWLMAWRADWHMPLMKTTIIFDLAEKGGKCLSMHFMSA
ncbi:hypothetical protein ACOTCL_17675 [Achromobacter xylosoxidans]